MLELASMLAGERFSDHPRSNEYAAKVVGTAGSDQLEALRRERLLEWGAEMRRPRSILVRLRSRPPHEPTAEAVARYGIDATRRVCDQTHDATLRLIAELVALGARATNEPAADRGAAWLDGTSREERVFSNAESE